MTAESANTVEEEAIPPPSPPVQPPAHPLSTGAERVNVKSPRRKEGVESRQTSTHSSDGGIESEESVTTVGSLQLQELATPTPKKKSTTIQVSLLDLWMLEDPTWSLDSPSSLFLLTY